MTYTYFTKASQGEKDVTAVRTNRRLVEKMPFQFDLFPILTDVIQLDHVL